MNFKSSKYKQMIDVKIKHNLRCTLEDDLITDYYADSNLGGAIIKMSIPGHSFFRGHFNNDPRISKIDFELKLKSGPLSWLDIWKTIDDFIIEKEIDRAWIETINIYESKMFIWDEKQIYIEPFLTC